jgi:hypothetical protein
MDGSAFRNMDLSGLFSWPVLALLGIGLLTVIGPAGFVLWWIVSHLQWVW